MKNRTKVLKKKNGVALKKPKTPIEDIIFNCFTHCEPDDELSTIQKELIKNAMVEYAQLKCREQRSLCVNANGLFNWISTDERKELILNAEEPTYE